MGLGLWVSDLALRIKGFGIHVLGVVFSELWYGVKVEGLGVSGLIRAEEGGEASGSSALEWV